MGDDPTRGDAALTLEELAVVMRRIKTPASRLRAAPDVVDWMRRRFQRPYDGDGLAHYFGLRIVIDPELPPGAWRID